MNYKVRDCKHSEVKKLACNYSPITKKWNKSVVIRFRLNGKQDSRMFLLFLEPDDKWRFFLRDRLYLLSWGIVWCGYFLDLDWFDVINCQVRGLYYTERTNRITDPKKEFENILRTLKNQNNGSIWRD